MKAQQPFRYGRYGIISSPFFRRSLRGIDEVADFSAFRQSLRGTDEVAGFSDGFESLAQFREQLIGPMILPFRSITAALTELIDLIDNLATTLVLILDFEIGMAADSITKAGQNIVDIGYFLCMSIFHLLWESAALISRTAATLVSLVLFVGEQAAQSLFFNPTTELQGNNQNYSFDTTKGLEYEFVGEQEAAQSLFFNPTADLQGNNQNYWFDTTKGLEDEDEDEDEYTNYRSDTNPF